MTSRILLALSILLAPAVAFAGPDAPSWNRDLERLDYYENPPGGGDQAFFTAVSQKGVVSLLYETHSSMNQLPTSLYEMVRPASGTLGPYDCSNGFVNSLRYFMGSPDAGALAGTAYDPTQTYPDPEPAYTQTVTISDNLCPNAKCTDKNSVWQFGTWPAGPTASPTGTYTADTVDNQCAKILAGGSADPAYATCKSCVSQKGYYLNPQVLSATPNSTAPNAALFNVNFLRFYPPKWVLLKLAYKRLLNSSLLSTIREGIVATNGTKGGQLIQKLLPSSCSGQGAVHGQGILKQKVQALDGMNYSGNAGPLAEMLFNTGYYMSGDSSTWEGAGGYFTNPATIGLSGDDGRGGPCPGCQQDFLVLFSDGRGDTANPYCTAAGVGPCQAAAQCSTLGMGAEDDGNDFLDPSLAGGAGTLITGATVRQTPGGTCDMDFADDVAGWMFKNPMVQTIAGSNVITYVVGVGSERFGAMNPLKAIANRGGGQYVNATDFQSLESQIRTVLLQIIQKATSFSVAAITTVQTRGSTFAFIPRFKPLQGNEWEGKLYRFKLFNEFSAGCTAADYAKTGDWVNPNADNTCTNIYLQDADSTSASSTPTIPGPNFWSSFVGEDGQGNFVKLDTSKPYDIVANPNGWPALNPQQLAKPVWEASSHLANRVRAGTDPRTIFTVYDSTGNGVYDTLLPFDKAHVATIAPLLKLNGGVNSDFCVEIAAISKHTYSTLNDCVSDLIDFIQGKDVLVQNPLNQTNPPPSPLYARPNILGDIFHSSPILVHAPIPTLLGNLGVDTQDAPTLWGGSSCIGTPNGCSAWQSYLTAQQYRTQLLIVGANDGMFHAFNAGNDQTGDDPETPSVESATSHHFDLGTGREMWAFIPPDLLPKLPLYMNSTRHEVFVDGTPMVRDIWVDANNDNQKQAGEFHTIAVIGERDGGRHWFGLEITDPANPLFRWSWPPAGSTEDLVVGNSWADFAPYPPPIGPIAEEDTAGPYTVTATDGTVHKAHERWVVGLGGGFDPNYIRGRGVYVLDAYTGKELYGFRAADASGPSDLRSQLFPVAAAMAFVDANNDGLFDTMIFGDTLGQLWSTNMLAPGKSTSGTGLYDTWFTGRAFISQKNAAVYNKSPFHAIVGAITTTSGEAGIAGVRALVGTGDRYQIKDSSVTSCGIDNLIGCLRRGCQVDVKQSTYSVGSHSETGEWKWSSGATPLATLTNSIDASGTAYSCLATDTDQADVVYSLTCGTTSATFETKLLCDWGASSPGVECPTNTPKAEATQYTPGIVSCSDPINGTGPCFTPSVTPVASQFYAVELYNGTTRKRPTAATGAGATAQTYDTAALTESDLVNVTTTGVANANGWYVLYGNNTEKTASAPLILGGCAIWNSLLPSTAAPTCSAALPLDTANLYQADLMTGAIQCGSPNSQTYSATARYTSRTAKVPPPSPTPVIAYNSTSGQVSYSGISLEPGNPPLQVQVGKGDVLGTIEWLEVSRQTHNCRHGSGSCVQQ